MLRKFIIPHKILEINQNESFSRNVCIKTIKSIKEQTFVKLSLSLNLSLSLRDRDRADTIITLHHTTVNFLIAL